MPPPGSFSLPTQSICSNATTLPIINQVTHVDLVAFQRVYWIAGLTSSLTQRGRRPGPFSCLLAHHPLGCHPRQMWTCGHSSGGFDLHFSIWKHLVCAVSRHLSIISLKDEEETTLHFAMQFFTFAFFYVNESTADKKGCGAKLSRDGPCYQVNQMGWWGGAKTNTGRHSGNCPDEGVFNEEFLRDPPFLSVHNRSH